MNQLYAATVFQANVSVGTAAQDMVEITGGTTGCWILSAFIGQVGTSDTGEAQEECLRIIIRRYATSGSAGSSGTFQKHHPSNPTISSTAEISNTTAGGTPTDLIEESFNVRHGWVYQPIPSEMIWVPPSGILAFRIPSTNDAISLTCRVTIGEP